MLFVKRVAQIFPYFFYLLFYFRLFFHSLNRCPMNLIFYFSFFIFAFFLLLFKLLPKKVFSFRVFLTIFLFITFVPSFIFVHPPRPLDAEHKTLKIAASWFSNSNLIDRPLCSSHPYFYILIDKDAFENFECRVKKFNENLQPGTILLWESHYGPRFISKEFLETNYLLLKSFYLDQKYEVLFFEIK